MGINSTTRGQSLKLIRLIATVLVISLIAPLSLMGCSSKDIPQFSDETMFTLKTREPWIYESLEFTLMCDGTLLVQYRGRELGREQLSEERMAEINKVFNPKKVYTMNVGKENENMTDGTARYIYLYDAEGNQIEIGGYELKGGDNFNRYFDKLYALCEDDYTKQFSDLLLECMSEGVTYQDKYLT